MSAILRNTCALIFSALLLGPPVCAQEKDSLAIAAEPIVQGVPEVAVTRLRALLSKSLRDEEWQDAALPLTEALIESGQASDALTLLSDPRFAATTAAKFWRAQALLALYRWNEALPLFQSAARDPAFPRRAEATFGVAETLRSLDRVDEALAVLSNLLPDQLWSVRARLRSAELLIDRADWNRAESMLDGLKPATMSDRREGRFLRARLELGRGRPERALTTFEALVKKPEGASHAVILAALFGIADVHLKLKSPEAGDDLLEDFIDRHPQDPDLPRIFAKLDELYRAERKPARVELEKWTRETEQPRRAFAQWYLARIQLRAGHRDRAVQLLSELRKSAGNNPSIAEALLEFAQLQLEDGHRDDAIAILEEARALQPEAGLLNRVNLLSGEAHYAAGQFEPATARFEEVAHSSPPWASAALFNASLGWLRLGNPERFQADYNELPAGGGGEQARADLRLEEGLVQAAKGDKAATETLRKFLRDFPQSARASEAWVALAELSFHAAPPRLDDARKQLARASQSNPTPAAIERADYLNIWIEDSVPGSDQKVIDAATRFVALHANSRFTADVRMKLAEAFYRRQDFANAQTQFESLAQLNPSQPITEKALFFAAQAAMSTMGPHSLDRAIELFDRVVQMKGDLRWAARNEQAVIERKLGRPQEALVLYEEVLKNDARPADKREALCGRGDIYFDMGPDDPKNYERALEAYEQLATDASEPGHWRNQALFKKGVCLEKKADREGALAAFYKVLETQTRPDRPPEFFWFYKAGFNAARLLEDAAKWESAAAVYEKLAASGGTRSDEAKARLSRLRLEHFLWGN